MNSQLNDKVTMFEKVLIGLGCPKLSKSNVFKVDECSDVYFSRVILKEKDTILLTLEFSKSGIDIHLDGSSEVFSWGNEFIENNLDEVLDVMKIILTSEIRVESYGKAMKKFCFIDADKKITLLEFKVFESLFINPFRKAVKTFPPIL